MLKKEKKSHIYRKRTGVFSLKELPVQAVRLMSFGTRIYKISWCLTLEARRRSLSETGSLLIQRRSHTQLLMSQNATVMEYMIISRLARSLFSSSKSCSRRFSLMICTDKWEKHSHLKLTLYKKRLAKTCSKNVPFHKNSSFQTNILYVMHLF